MEVIIEQLGTTHNVLDRQKFRLDDLTADPFNEALGNYPKITIGRAYSNDLILTDEHIDEWHASLQLDEDGQLWIIDYGSLNGIKKLKGKTSLERQLVASGDIFVIGRNKIRILFGDHPVPATVKIRFSEVFLLWLGRLPVLAALVLGYILVKGLSIYFTTSTELNWGSIVSNNLQSSLGFVGLALLVYLLSILFKRGGNFLSHLGVLMLVYFVSVIAGFAIHLLKFNTGAGLDGLMDFLEAANGYLVLFLYLWCILYLAFHISLQRRTVISLGLVAMLVGINLLNSSAFEDFFATSVRSDESLLPPAFLLKTPENNQSHFERAFSMFEQVALEKQLRQQEKQSKSAR